MRSAVFILVFVTALLLLSGGVESKRKKREKKSLFKDRSKKKSGKGSPGDEPDVEEIKFESEEEKQEILQKLQRERQAKEKMGDEPPSSKEMVKLKMQERELRRELGEAVMKYGDDSKEKATVLHKVGYNLFKQVRFEDLWDISLEIVRIHELHDGPESVETGKALSNCAQTAFRLGKRDECGLASYRYLYIMIKHMGLQSKEVVMARARLMQYHFRDGETSKGMSYAEYLATKGIATDEDAGDEFDEDHIEL
jgi:hypothetical protein